MGYLCDLRREGGEGGGLLKVIVSRQGDVGWKDWQKKTVDQPRKEEKKRKRRRKELLIVRASHRFAAGNSDNCVLSERNEE